MKVEPINKKIHEVLITKGFTWKARAHVDVYQKEGTLIFIYMIDHCFMLINGKVATSKEFENATTIWDE